MSRRAVNMAGFILLPVILAMSLIAAIAFLLNRDAGMNAAMVSRQTDADRARFAAEAGLQTVNAVIQGKNCAGGYPSAETPVINSAFGGAGYSAYADPSAGNTTSLFSTGTYNGTSVTLTRSNVIAYQSAPNTYTLQPDAAAGLDSTIRKNLSSNYGNADVIEAHAGSRYAVLKFDVSMFPAGSLPLSAAISLYARYVGGGLQNVVLYRLSNSWVEGNGSSGSGVNWTTRDGTLAWTTPGGDYHPVAVASIASLTLNTWHDFDVTDLATAWLLGRYPNNGVFLNASNGDQDFDSSDASSATTRPKMVLNYLVPCGATGPSDPAGGSVTLNPAADSAMDNQAATTNYGNDTTVRWQYASASDEQRALLRFDTSSIAPGTPILTATLRLNVAAVVGATANVKTIGAFALTQSWTENLVTWNRKDAANWTTAGGTYRTPAVAYASEESSGLSPPPGSFTTGWLNWNLKALTQEWVDGVTPNNGVLLISTVADEHRAVSKEGAAANRPQLVITW